MTTAREARMLADSDLAVSDPMGILASLESRVGALIRARASEGKYYVEIHDDFAAHEELAMRRTRGDAPQCVYSAEALRTRIMEVLASVGFETEAFSRDGKPALKIMW